MFHLLHNGFELCDIICWSGMHVQPVLPNIIRGNLATGCLGLAHTNFAKGKTNRIYVMILLFRLLLLPGKFISLIWQNTGEQ